MAPAPLLVLWEGAACPPPSLPGARRREPAPSQPLDERCGCCPGAGGANGPPAGNGYVLSLSLSVTCFHVLSIADWYVRGQSVCSPTPLVGVLLAPLHNARNGRMGRRGIRVSRCNGRGRPPARSPCRQALWYVPQAVLPSNHFAEAEMHFASLVMIQ